MRLVVLRFMGNEMKPPLAADFGQAGGTIGRDAACTLVLPDPYRHISRVQADVACFEGVFVITDRGTSNPVLKGEQEIGRNRQATLQKGDLLTIGDYEILVQIEAPSGASMSGIPAAPLAAAQPGGAVTASTTPASLSDAPGGFPQVPPTQFWHQVSAVGGAGDDPFAGLLDGLGPGPAATPTVSTAPGMGETVRSPARGNPLPDAQAAGGFAIPEDFDVFATPEPKNDGLVDVLGRDTGRVGAPLSGIDDPLGPLGGQHKVATAESIDALFGLSGASANPLGSDSALADPLSAPNMAGSVDPLVALSRAAAPSSAPVPDRVPEIHGSLRIPQPMPQVDGPVQPLVQTILPRDTLPPIAEPVGLPTVPDGPTSATTIAPPVSSPEAPLPIAAQAASQASSFRSWDNPEQSASSMTFGAYRPAVAQEPSPMPAPAAPAPPDAKTERPFDAMVDAALDAHGGAFEPIPKTRPTQRIDALNAAALQAAAAAGLPAPQNNVDELLNALLAGLGLPALPRSPDAHAPAPTLSPELMRKIGALLRIATQGSLDLLAARAMLKKEMRSEVTMIVTQNNNPMKFSPDAIAALSQMLAPRTLRGFMEAVPAMQDTFNDLMAHQVGFVAGMRAAMQGLVERFDPAQLEQRITSAGLIDSLVPMSRKARLWERFNELYAQISQEAEDDFEALFGRAFVKAYEDQIRLLDGAQGNVAPDEARKPRG